MESWRDGKLARRPQLRTGERNGRRKWVALSRAVPCCSLLLAASCCYMLAVSCWLLAVSCGLLAAHLQSSQMFSADKFLFLARSLAHSRNYFRTMHVNWCICGPWLAKRRAQLASRQPPTTSRRLHTLGRPFSPARTGAHRQQRLSLASYLSPFAFYMHSVASTVYSPQSTVYSFHLPVSSFSPGARPAGKDNR